MGMKHVADLSWLIEKKRFKKKEGLRSQNHQINYKQRKERIEEEEEEIERKEGGER